MQQPTRSAALEGLDAFVDEWDTEGSHPLDPALKVRGRAAQPHAWAPTSTKDRGSTA